MHVLKAVVQVSTDLQAVDSINN